MSASYNVIQLRRTGTPGKIPTTSDIHQGELAFNYNDNTLFISDGTVVHQINSTAYLTTVDGQAVPTATQVTNISNNYVPLAGGTLTGELTLNPSAQTGTNDAATLGQVATAISTALSSYESTLTGAASTVTTSNLTPNLVVVSDTNGKIAVGTASTTQVNALSSLSDTSAVVTDINGNLITSATTAAQIGYLTR